MPAQPSVEDVLDPETRAFYERTLRRLAASEIPFLVGGALAFEHYTGIGRNTRDLDIFVRPMHRDAVLDLFADAGEETDLSFAHWLAKIRSGDDYVDIIFSSGNGIAEVDAQWFEHSVPANVLGVPVALTPVEEMIWSKAFVMERERFDGADVVHLIRACGAGLEWSRLLVRFGGNWRVLLSHLVIFGFVFPAERTTVPAEIVRDLAGRLAEEADSAADPADDRAQVCMRPLISRQQYLVDVEPGGLRDGRLPPTGRMTPEEVDAWTAAMRADEARAGRPVSRA